MITGKFIYQNKNCNKSLREGRKFEQCFVWKADELPIYIMDNHRAALWCWYHSVESWQKNQKLLHIDNHEDMSPKGTHCQCAKNMKLPGMSINEYLEKKHISDFEHLYNEQDENLFSYENFLRILSEKPDSIVKSKDIFLTNSHWENKPVIDPKIVELMSQYKLNDKNSDCIQISRHLYLTELLDLFQNDTKNKWVVDLDLDYFCNEENYEINFVLAKKLISQIKHWHDQRKIMALTIAWSPEYLVDHENKKEDFTNDGWLLAKKLNNEFCNIFGIDTKDFEKL